VTYSAASAAVAACDAMQVLCVYQHYVAHSSPDVAESSASVDGARRSAFRCPSLQQRQVPAVAERLQYKTRRLGDGTPLYHVLGARISNRCRHLSATLLRRKTSTTRETGSTMAACKLVVLSPNCITTSWTEPAIPASNWQQPWGTVAKFFRRKVANIV